MLHSDVRSGQKVAIYDRTTGLIVGAFAERLSGSFASLLPPLGGFCPLTTNLFHVQDSESL
jgi:hypothetical protein